MKKIIATFPIIKTFGGAEITAQENLKILSKNFRVLFLYCGEKINKNLYISSKIKKKY